MKKKLLLLLIFIFSGFSIAAQTIESVTLLPNQPIEREIGKDKTDKFTFKVNAGNFWRVTVQQKNADVEVKLYNSEAKSFYEVNNSNSREEIERASFIAEKNDEIRIEIAFVRKLSGTVQGKDYSINLEVLRPAIEKDNIRLKAERLYDEANRMRLKSERESRQNSIKVFQESARMFAEAGDSLGEAFVYYSLGQTQSLLSNFAESQKNYAQSATIFRNLNLRPQYARAITDQAATYFFERKFEQSEALCLEALRIFEELADRRGEAEIVGNLGAIYNAKDQSRKALEYYFRALPILRTENDKLQEGSVLSRIGLVYDDLGEPFNALEYYENALKIRRELKDERTEAYTLANMSVVLKNLGYYDRAVEANERALKIFSQIGQKYGEAVTLNNLGNINNELNDNEKALEFYEKSLGISREIKLRDNEAGSLMNIANLKLSDGDTAAALQISNTCLEIFRELKNKRGEARTLVKLGEIYLKKSDSPKALEFLNQALLIFRETEDRTWEGTTLFLIGEAKRLSGDLQTARNSYLAALKIKSELKEISDEAQNLLALAKVEKESGNFAEAQKYVAQSIEILENTRTNLSRSNQRATYFSTKQSFYEFYINLLIQRHKADSQKGFDTLAFEISERARARSLLESLGESRFNIRAGVSPENLEKEKQLRQTINAKDTLRLNALNFKQTEKAKVFEKELDDLLQQYANVQETIRAESPQLTALNQPEILSLSKLQAEVLDEDSVLLEYSLGEEKSFLFAADKSSLEVVELPGREQIEKTARLYIESLKAVEQNDLRETPQQREQRLKIADTNWKEHGKTLSRILLGGISNKLKNKRLLVVSSGILQYVPFASLFGKENSEQFLIETNEIVNLPSASIIPVLRENKKRKTNKNNTIGILADPVFSKEDVRLKTASKENSVNNTAAAVNIKRRLRSDFSRLRFSRREAEEISKFANADQSFMALDFGANMKNAFGPEIQNARFVHFATHGIINSQFPELSAVVLSLVDENGTPQNGLLQLHDIYNLRLNADLVVISACDSALGREIKGEGIIGLTRGFMYAGAPSIVASLWKVEDRATAELMKRFYRAMLKDKQKPATALRTAQIEMIKDEQWQKPFYWAAFTLQGEWQ